MKKQVTKAADLLASSHIDRNPDEQIPLPSKEYLERKFKMDFKQCGKPVIEAIKS